MKPIVAVLRGGPSLQYDSSLETGGYILKHMPEKYEKRDIFIDKEGNWHREGFQVKPQQALDGTAVVWNSLLGNFGEDGKVQRILDSMNMRYVGSDPISSAQAMNKKLAKKLYSEAGIRTPLHIIVESGEDLDKKASQIFFEFHMPVVIKPVSSGGSVGTGIARSRADIVPLLEEALTVSNSALVETYIIGSDIVCVVTEGLRGEEHYVSIPIEISYPKGTDIFNEMLKKDKTLVHKETFHLSDAVKNEIASIARLAHKVLGLRHHSRSDLRLTPTGRIYLLETNSVPLLHENSPTVQSLQSVGIDPQMYIDHLISLA